VVASNFGEQIRAPPIYLLQETAEERLVVDGATKWFGILMAAIAVAVIGSAAFI
jgi:hypothetical protein